ncbi:aldolase [Microbulbifer taiwanensis]|uniref:aldolase n=1 Tax=Microbulbifer taiwanensis TaxID=986746 RepID=UPI003613D651
MTEKMSGGETLSMEKDELVHRAQDQMRRHLEAPDWSLREKVALTCHILFAQGHDSGLAGQITARAPAPGNYYTQRLGLGFDEISASNLLTVNEDLEVLSGDGMANPANRFHSWIYRARPDVRCIVHTHPLHISALSMLGRPLKVSHMDTCPLHGEVAFLEEWPGVPVGNGEGRLSPPHWGTNARHCSPTTAW